MKSCSPFPHFEEDISPLDDLFDRLLAAGVKITDAPVRDERTAPIPSSRYWREEEDDGDQPPLLLLDRDERKIANGQPHRLP